MAGRAQAPGLGLMEPAQFPTLPCTLLPLPAPPGTHHFPLPDLLSEACPESVPRGGGRHGAMTNGRNEEKRGGGGAGHRGRPANRGPRDAPPAACRTGRPCPPAPRSAAGRARCRPSPPPRRQGRTHSPAPAQVRGSTELSKSPGSTNYHPRITSRYDNVCHRSECHACPPTPPHTPYSFPPNNFIVHTPSHGASQI